MSEAPVTAGAPAPQKLDPESLVLRASPARVTRFRRGAIIGIAGASSTAVLAIAWLALKPATLNLMPSGDEQGRVATAVPQDVLAGSPKGYDEIPELGPPLPGDLGRPILNHQREMASGEASDPAIGTEQQHAEAELQRIAAEERSARQSGIMLQLASSRPAIPSFATTGTSSPDLAQSIQRPAQGQARDPNGQQRKLDFLAQPDPSGDINPHSLAPLPSPYTLLAGSIISASLITGLNSDLPGLVTAQVTEHIYDTATGRILLVPQGTRLIGNYDSVVAFGQKRALVAWHRMIFPDGSSIRVDNLPASDLEGYAGLFDRVDRHGWQLFKGVVLSTLLGIGTELGSPNDESGSAEAAHQRAARAGDELVTRNLDVQPTLRVRPGWPLRVLIHKDIVLKPWRTR